MSSDWERADDPADRSAKVERMARSLIDLFGERALEVSERQINGGSVASVSLAWQEIVADIRRLIAEGNHPRP